ncbi:MAG: hypothetical protein ACI8RD_013989, partial [Bacillariaceae sp.]
GAINLYSNRVPLLSQKSTNNRIVRSINRSSLKVATGIILYYIIF